MMLIFVLGVINIGIVLGVFVLLLWQLYLISYNTTTIEFYEQRDRSKVCTLNLLWIKMMHAVC